MFVNSVWGRNKCLKCPKIPKIEKRMVVSVDTRRMNKIKELDKKEPLATVESGILGIDLEKQLNDHGYTADMNLIVLNLTLGGWISTNASGMKNIDMEILKILYKMSL